MPHQLDIKCPACQEKAQFEFAEVQKIFLKEDIDFFKSSKVFEYRKFQDSCGHYWHGALYYAGLHGDPDIALGVLPQGYTPSDWKHSTYLYRSHNLEIGSVRCYCCGLRAKHKLQWPEDAYFSVSYKNQLLWAFNQESAQELHDYLLSFQREHLKYKWAAFLLHVPTVFKTRKASWTISKQLLRLVEGKR